MFLDNVKNVLQPVMLWYTSCSCVYCVLLEAFSLIVVQEVEQVVH